MHRKRVNISTVLAGQRLGVKEVGDGTAAGFGRRPRMTSCSRSVRRWL